MTRLGELIFVFIEVFQDPVWIAPAVLMVLGLVAGVVAAIFLTSRSDANRVEAEQDRRDWEEVRDATIDAIRRLDLEKDKLDPEDYEREKRLLLGHGAGAMRALEAAVEQDEQRQALIEAVEAQRDALGEERTQAITALLRGEQPAAPPQQTQAPKQGLRVETGLVLGGLGILAGLFSLFLILLGMQSRPEPVQPMAGRAPAAAPGRAPAPELPPPGPAEQAMLETLESNPDDMDALNGLTDFEIRRQQWDTASAYNTRALELNAEDPEARVWHALLVYREGNFPKAVAELESVMEAAPNYPRAHQFRGMIHLQMRQFEPALERFQKALELTEDAEAKAGIQRLIGDTRQAMQASKPELGGTIRLAEGVSSESWGSSAMIFVSVKAPTGPPMPLRAKRVPIGEFPLEFDLSGMDAPMRGGPLPETVTVTVKVDLDGNPMGDDEGAPKVVIEGVKTGTLDLDVELGAG